MIAAPFDYVRAESVAHALQLLEQHGENARLLAGGHSLIPAMRLRLAEPKLLVDIGRIKELQYVRQESGQLRIGALATHFQLESSADVQKLAPALAEAASVIADVQVRNKGTIGGVLGHADPMADYPAVLLALGAEVVVTGRQGSRTVPADQFFTGPFATALKAGELITEVRVPLAPAGSGSVYRKFVRRASDYGLTGVGCSVTLSAGLVSDMRIGIACVSLTPYRATRSEAALRGKNPTPEAIAAAAERATEGISVNEDAYTPADYRAHLCQVETRRAIEAAVAKAQT